MSDDTPLPTALILLSCEEVLPHRSCRNSAVTDRRYRRGTNEVDRTNILAPGFRRFASRRTHTFFPPSPLLAQAIGHGKSYPVTAAQLLPITHGISRADPLIKLAKNCGQK